MKTLTFAGLLYLTATAAFAENPTYNADIVKTACSTEWGTEYEMVAYCLKEARAGYDEFIHILNASNPSLSRQFDQCQTEWGNEWGMVTHCANENIQAQRELETMLPDLPPNIATEIKSRCTKEWGIEIPMIVYCANERAAGWRSINN